MLWFTPIRQSNAEKLHYFLLFLRQVPHRVFAFGPNMLFEKGPSCWSGAGYAGCEAYLDLRQSKDFTLAHHSFTHLCSSKPWVPASMSLANILPKHASPKENDPKTQTPALRSSASKRNAFILITHPYRAYIFGILFTIPMLDHRCQYLIFPESQLDPNSQDVPAS